MGRSLTGTVNEARANAALIVKAVNERDELITVLRQFTAIVEMWQLASATHKAVDDANEVLARADAAP
jgi:hypothetical protein